MNNRRKREWGVKEWGSASREEALSNAPLFISLPSLLSLETFHAAFQMYYIPDNNRAMKTHIGKAEKKESTYSVNNRMASVCSLIFYFKALHPIISQVSCQFPNS